MCMYRCGGQRTVFKELDLSSHHVGPVDQTQRVKCDGRSICSYDFLPAFFINVFEKTIQGFLTLNSSQILLWTLLSLCTTTLSTPEVH